MENQNAFVEKRRSVRFAVSTPVRYCIYTRDDKKPLSEWMQGTTENVSVDGMKIKTLCDNEQIEILTNEYIVLTVDFTLPGTRDCLTCESRLVYFNKSADSENNQTATVFLGLSFMNIDEKGKNIISEFIRC